MSQAERSLLGNEGCLDSPTTAVAHRIAHLARIVINAHHDADIMNARIANGFDHTKQHRFICHRHELLGVRIRQRVESRPFTAAQDESFHKTTSL